MPTLIMYQVDAFADRAFQGNPAAVLILEDWLADDVMQAIANENNLAETAFARRNGKGWDLRWFTPVHEVDFCGHATLATAHVLASQHNVADDMAFATRVGELRVSQRQGAYQLDLPCFPPQPVDGETVSALRDILSPHPVAGFRNFENLFVEFADEQSVRSFVPDLLRIGAFHPLGARRAPFVRPGRRSCADPGSRQDLHEGGNLPSGMKVGSGRRSGRGKAGAR
ncbi:PhzF family phenazine biosynthesis isomerase [Mesorhizobium sp. M7D.F.Ca.US.005.01.1.1]|uniref:PhzF family phenazine biosynthesis protein n=1 Tax=Mesorhizobium sp. M7D.F.Ca.US.005.01.1.1 TaxID=2493678 RepID=UPI001FE20988|nr:PhzF family phenazine biosynthesis isomerase [Mesorhizobium sp. M7D.F.Ca.US.005.01.1.1]